MKEEEKIIITVRLRGKAVGTNFCRVHKHPSPPQSFVYYDPDDKDYVIVEHPNGKKVRLKMPR